MTQTTPTKLSVNVADVYRIAALAHIEPLRVLNVYRREGQHSKDDLTRVVAFCAGHQGLPGPGPGIKCPRHITGLRCHLDDTLPDRWNVYLLCAASGLRPIDIVAQYGVGSSVTAMPLRWRQQRRTVNEAAAKLGIKPPTPSLGAAL